MNQLKFYINRKDLNEKAFGPGDGCVDSAADRAADIHAAVNGHLIDITPPHSLGLGVNFSLRVRWHHRS